MGEDEVNMREVTLAVIVSRQFMRESETIQKCFSQIKKNVKFKGPKSFFSQLHVLLTAGQQCQTKPCNVTRLGIQCNKVITYFHHYPM